MSKGAFTVWFTGLSASGKSTICQALAEHLKKETDMDFQVIDGDCMRQTINANLGYTQAERNIASERIARVVKKLNDDGMTCLVSNISQDKAIRSKVRNIIGNFVLVFVDTPVDVCEQRDYKQNYEKAKRGEIEEFVGVTEEYERADEAEIIIDTVSTKPEAAANLIVNYLREERWLGDEGKRECRLHAHK